MRDARGSRNDVVCFIRWVKQPLVPDTDLIIQM